MRGWKEVNKKNKTYRIPIHVRLKRKKKWKNKEVEKERRRWRKRKKTKEQNLENNILLALSWESYYHTFLLYKRTPLCFLWFVVKTYCVNVILCWLCCFGLVLLEVKQRLSVGDYNIFHFTLYELKRFYNFWGLNVNKMD